MNSNSEALQDLFAWLLQAPPTDASNPDGESSSPGKTTGNEGIEDLELTYSDPLDSEEVSRLFSNCIASEGIPLDEQGGQQLKLGEIPAVQDRFFSLLKRQLKTEIQRTPPLFPWESDVLEYPDYLIEEQVPERLWTAQLHKLNLPTRLPENILTQLFDRCAELVDSGLREGAKLVRAVEALFPDDLQALNYWADLVLRPAPRSPRPETDFPEAYESATPTQQMVLSLMAAREIIGNLTLNVSPSQHKQERQWLTAVGMLTLEVEYRLTEHFPSLRVASQLPCGGSLVFRCGQSQATAQRPDPGYLSVEVFDPQPGQVYSLEVRFHNLDQKPLILAVCPTN
ncbi:MAG: hypothetical protein N3E45_07425 [Oscillatoriaceae bacterium SKW80]|nr:hypothetical protein [Oscillatoriaceae bacterium SKYG93]MCX8120646.1 hypothetical protein [Oscillatoriaceae bacterium SKW80]MDW8453816.1 hypothetical protein [Oscillatoriaceae cyanobacterium SKYGB_i_bin93]HIK27046.1 hypothetical protein [Oscillatoriaceae cyanobacterium M7585_C2015_266]